VLPNIGIPELILILALALIVFGPGKLPEVGKSLGKTIREFRKSSRETFADVTDSIKEVKEDVYEAKRTLEVTKEEEAPKSAQS